MSACAKWLGVILLLVAGSALAEEKIVWQTDIAKALKQAKDEKKLVLVHFYGDACAPCRVVEEKVFPDPRVVRAMMRNYVPVKINVDKEDKIASRYGVREMPIDIFLTPGKGQEVNRMVTKDSAVDYATMLDQYAIQTGIGSARQAALQEREARYISPENYQGGQQPPAQQQYVQNGYTAQNEAGGNRYSQYPADPQSHVAGMPREAVQTVYGGAEAGSGQPQVGPYGPQAQAPVVQPEMVQGYGPQGGQRTSFQDPGDITGRQPIHNNFIPLKDIPPIGLDGYCPVSVAPRGNQEGAWKKGDPRFGAVHRGRTYLFASAAEQTKFLADPDAFSPMLSGADAVIFAETGKLVEGRRSFGMAFPQNDGRNTMYFFATKENLERFEKNPQQFAVKAHQAMLQGETQRKYR